MTGGIYLLELRSVEAGQTAVIDVRALRDGQVADEQGRVIPSDAASGQVHWSLDSTDDDRALIGRAEQADVVHGLSSSYACANCCGDTISDWWCDPGSVTGFPGDTTQFRAFQQNQDCYGTLFAPFLRTATWSSTSAAVATVNASGLATAQSPGSTRIQATWTVTTYVERPDGLGCSRVTYHPIAEAICDVLNQELNFTRVTKDSASADFNSGITRQIATLNLGGAPGGSAACNGERFTIAIEFTFPEGGTIRDRTDPLNIVKTGANNQFEWLSWDFIQTSPTLGRGSMFIELFRRKKTNPDKHVDFDITGKNPPGTTGGFVGRGRVVLNCP